MSTLNVAINASGAKAGADSFNRSIDKMGRSVDKFSKDAPRKMKATFASITRHAKLMVAGLVAGFGLAAREFIKVSDEMKNLTGRLSLVTGSFSELIQVQRDLLVVSNEARVSYSGTVDLYAKLARATEEYGTSQKTLLGITETISKSLIISGASATEASAALMQLGQGMASGVLRGEELNSILEQTPRLAQLIAEGMGVTVGQLRKLGAEGLITTERIVNAVQSQGEAIDDEFKKMPVTVSQAFTIIKNEIKFLVSWVESLVGIGSAIANWFIGIAEGIGKLREEMAKTEEAANKLKQATEPDPTMFDRWVTGISRFSWKVYYALEYLVKSFTSFVIAIMRSLWESIEGTAKGIPSLVMMIIYDMAGMKKASEKMYDEMTANTKESAKKQVQIWKDYADETVGFWDTMGTKMAHLPELVGKVTTEAEALAAASAKAKRELAAISAKLAEELNLAAKLEEANAELAEFYAGLDRIAAAKALGDFNAILEIIARNSLPEFEQGLQDIETKYDDLIDAVKEYGDAAGKEFKEIADAVDKLESLKGNKLADYAKDATKATDDLLESISSLDFEGMSFGNEIADGINNAVISMNALIDVSDSYVDKLEELAEQKKKGIDVTEAQATLEQNYIKAQVSGYRQLFGTMSQLFDEGSKEREAMHKAEMAFAAIELAMSIKQMAMDVIKTVQAVTSSNTRTTALAGEAVMSATAGIAGQATGDPYTAFPRIAAMIALMGAVLAMGGISFGGGGGSSGGGGGGSSPTTGTVLGDPTKSSESLKNSLDMMEDYHAEDYKELVGIHNELKSLNNNISGLVSNIVRNFGDFDASQYEGSWIRESGKKFESWVEAGPGRLFIDKFTKSIVSWSTGLINKGLEVLFGGEKEVKSYGAELGRTDTSTVEDVLAGQMPSVEAYYYWKQKGGLTGSTKRGTEHEEVDEGVSRFFGKLYEDISNVLVYLGEGFGYTAEQMAEVFAYEFAHVQLDLKGLTGAEIEEKIQAWISTTGDEAVEELFGEIVAKYQKLDEGMLEAAVRLIAQKVIVLSLLESINLAFDETGGSAIDFTQALIAVAGDFEDLIASISNYYDKFFTEEEKHADLTENLTTALADQNLVLPGTREGFRELVEGLDLTTEEGKEAFIVLMEAAEVADAYYSTIEKITESIKAITDAHDTYGQSLTETLSAKYGLDLSQYTYEDWHRFVESLGDLSQYSEEFRQDLLDLGMAYEDQYEALVDNIMGITGTTQAMLDNGTACENLVGYLNGLEAAMLEAGFTIEDVAATINAAMVIVIGSIADIYREMAYGRPATLAETIASHYEGVSASDIKGIDKAAWQGFVEDMVAAWEASESREDYGAWAEETYGAQFVADMEAWGRHLLVVVDDALTKSIRAIGVAYGDLERGRPATLAEEIASHYEGISASEIEGIDKEGWQWVVDEVIAAWRAAGSPEDYTTWAREQYGDQFFADMEAWGNHLMDEAEKAADEAAKAAAAFVEAMAGAIDFATTSMGWREMAPHAKSTSEQYTEQYKHIQDLWAAYTGTTVQAAVLSSAFGALSGLSYDLASEIRNAIVSINESYTSALASMYMETLTPQGKYDYYREEIRQMYAGMADITDPVKLKQYMDDILQYSTTAYGMLDEDQKKQYYGEYEAFLTKVQTEGTERLEALGDALDTANEALAAAAIAIQNASDRQLTAADLQLIAAQGQQAAADTPITVHVESGGGEVG